MAAPKRNHTIDYTPFSAVVVCHRAGCQWRGLSHSQASAWRQLAAHVRFVHRDLKAADYATRRATRRETDARAS